MGGCYVCFALHALRYATYLCTGPIGQLDIVFKSNRNLGMPVSRLERFEFCKSQVPVLVARILSRPLESQCLESRESFGEESFATVPPGLFVQASLCGNPASQRRILLTSIGDTAVIVGLFEGGEPLIHLFVYFVGCQQTRKTRQKKHTVQYVGTSERRASEKIRQKRW